MFRLRSLAVLALTTALVGGALSYAPAPPTFTASLAAQTTQAAPVRLVAPYRVTVGAAAVNVTASGNVRGVVLKAICPGQVIYIGADSGVTTATGYPMSDGETLTLEVRNANQIFAIASAAAQSLSVLPFERF